MTVAIIAIIAVLLVLGIGLLVFTLMRKSQTVVPSVADEDAARGSVFGEVVASGIYTMAIWRQLDHEIARDIAWICGVAWDDVRFPRALRAGDRVRARSRCLSKRASSSDPRRGIVEYQYELLTDAGEVVFTCRSTNLVERRPPA